MTIMTTNGPTTRAPTSAIKSDPFVVSSEATERGPHKLILTADTHIRESTPRVRREPALRTLADKLHWLAGLQKTLSGAPVLCAGDLFHAWDVNGKRKDVGVQALALAFRHIDNWIVTPGQHDLPHHRIEELGNSPLHLLEVADRIEILSDCTWTDPLPGVRVYGIPYGKLEEDLPRVLSVAGQQSHADHYRILLIHHFVYAGRPPFPGAEAVGIEAHELLRRCGSTFRLIVTGDHHTTFVTHNTDLGVTLVNPGPIYRMSADMMEHEPAVFVYDLRRNVLTQTPLPFDGADTAFDTAEIERYRRGTQAARQMFTSGLTGEGNDIDDGSPASASSPESWSAVPFEERLRLLLADMPPEVQAEVRLAWRGEVTAYDEGRRSK